MISFRRAAFLTPTVLLLTLAAACASVEREADELSRSGRNEEALVVLQAAAASAPTDHGLSAAVMRQKETTFNQLAYQADLARSSGRLEAARPLLDKMAAIDPTHPRTEALRTELDRARRHDRLLAEARAAMVAKRFSEADEAVRQVLAESPGHPAARQLAMKLREQRPVDAPARTLGPAFQKPVTLEFREAPLRSVLEALARTSGVNFVFDKEVRGDTKVSVYLKDVSVDDALKVILTTQQLDRKLLNDSTVFVYPNTQAKQREHQELVTRTFYLTNADVKQAQNLVRTITKSRDLFIDERLNMLVVRDTPEVLQIAERLIATLDLPEPEVVLEVEVLEIASNRLDELGLQWPDQISYGIPGVVEDVLLKRHDEFKATIANPAVVATLRNTTSRGNVLANPRLRARNKEKAKVLIGEKLPIFTTTPTGTVGGVAATVTYIDVGLKLDVEPSVQLDNDVVMKVGLEVSTLIGRVPGPQNSVAYQIGTRQANTSLRLRDGETQILAGLIRQEDTKGISGVPGLSELPVVGRLFGVHSDQRVRTEVVLLITPRVVRNLGLPDAALMNVASGVDASPGASSARLSPAARVGVPIAGAASPGGIGTVTAAAADPSAVLVLSTSGEVAVGETVSVTLQNRSTATVKGEMAFDASQLQSAGEPSTNGRLPFALTPGGEKVFVMRPLPPAAGQTVDVTLTSLNATRASGESPPVRVQGDGFILVTAQ